MKLVAPGDIPWPELAFPVVRVALELLVDELQRGRFRAHQGELVRRDGRYLLDAHLAVELA